MMHSCDGCGRTVAFGGPKVGNLRFCSRNCAKNATALMTIHEHSLTLPVEFIEHQVNQVFNGPCPRCGKDGRVVDFHDAHWAWSLLVMTQWKSTSGLCCQNCGTKSRIYATLSTGLLGWWGFPWGLVVTPIQIGRNVIGLTKMRRTEPSPELVDHIRMQLAHRDLIEQQAAQAEAEKRASGSPAS